MGGCFCDDTGVKIPIAHTIASFDVIT